MTPLIHVNKEILGLRFELVGLILILIATVWQVGFTDWFDKNAREWQSFIQEDVNIALLLGVRDLSRQIDAKDELAKRSAALNVIDRTAQAVSKAIKERDMRHALDQGQAKLFGTIRYSLFLLGASLVVLGKWFVLQHKRSNLGV